MKFFVKAIGVIALLASIVFGIDILYKKYSNQYVTSNEIN